MRLRTLVPAVAFLSALTLFAFAVSPFLSFSPVSLVHAQGVAPEFPPTEPGTRDVPENTAHTPPSAPPLPPPETMSPTPWPTPGHPTSASTAGADNSAWAPR